MQRLAGGSKKGVYRLVMDDAATAIACLWEAAENYWPAVEGDDDLTDPFSPGLGLDLFEAAHARLEGLGVRVPAIRLVDHDGAHGTGDLAIVEDVPGASLLDLLERDPRAAAPVMAELGEARGATGRHRAPAYGKVAVVDGGGASRGTSYEGVVLDRGLRLLDGGFPDRAFMAGIAEYDLGKALEFVGS